MGTRNFYVRSRFPELRFEITSVRTAREIGPACLFRFQSFEISADNHRCLHFYKETLRWCRFHGQVCALIFTDLFGFELIRG